MVLRVESCVDSCVLRDGGVSVGVFGGAVWGGGKSGGVGREGRRKSGGRGRKSGGRGRKSGGRGRKRKRRNREGGERRKRGGSRNGKVEMRRGRRSWGGMKREVGMRRRNTKVGTGEVCNGKVGMRR